MYVYVCDFLIYNSSGKDVKSSPSLGNSQNNDHTPSSQTTPTPNTKTSPPPVTYTPQNSTSSINSNTSITSPTTSNGETPLEMPPSVPGPSRSDSVSSDSGIVYFSPSVAGDARNPATGDAVRDRCRELVAKAMMKGFEKGTDWLSATTVEEHPKSLMNNSWEHVSVCIARWQWPLIHSILCIKMFGGVYQHPLHWTLLHCIYG